MLKLVVGFFNRQHKMQKEEDAEEDVEAGTYDDEVPDNSPARVQAILDWYNTLVNDDNTLSENEKEIIETLAVKHNNCSCFLQQQPYYYLG